jgi:hypothetical protein
MDGNAGLDGGPSLFGAPVRPMNPVEMYQIAQEFLSSSHPLVKPVSLILLALFVLPILGGMVILALEGRPRRATTKDSKVCRIPRYIVRTLELVTHSVCPTQSDQTLTKANNVEPKKDQ